jgi:hypothetical protein
MIEPLKPDKARESLTQAVIKTFEEMAFIDVVESPGASGNLKYENGFCIDLLKPISSKIILFLSEGLKKKIVENIFSTDTESLEVNQGDDCILEILNVLAGKFLSAYYGKNIEYKLEFPQVFMDLDEKDEYISVNLNAEGFDCKIILNTIRYRY